MSKLDAWIDNKIVQNLFIWICFFLILLVSIQADNRFLAATYIILLLSPAVYINNLFILPFFNKSWLRFIMLFLINAAVFTGINIFFIHLFNDQEIKAAQFLNLFGIMILALTFSSAIKISRDSFIRRQVEKNAELKLLKAQLNPHFLFNTLNNLYGMSVMKSDRLPDLMLKLSDLLRYSLYDTKETYVSLEKEIQYLENYISLEKIRLEDQTEITFTKKGAISEKKIAPMLLIVFVENAFKHLTSAAGLKSKVLVEIQGVNNKLEFSCINSMDEKGKEVRMESGKSGIGLKNAKKRLSLLYPEKHQLTIGKTENEHRVSLNIKL